MHSPGENGSRTNSTVLVSVTIPTCNRPLRLRSTLEQILACDPLPAEILIHFDGQPEDKDSIPSDCPIPLITSHSEDPLGPGGARNNLLKKASNEIVCSFDDDSHPIDSDYFQRVVDAFDHLPAAGALMAFVQTPGAPLLPLDPEARDCRGFSGSGVSYRRSAFLKTQGYVPLPLAYGMEESDMALQLHATGYSIYQTGWLRVRHDEADAGPEQNRRFAKAVLQNQALLAYLRYPLILAPIALYQWTRILAQAARLIPFQHLWLTITAIPSHLARHRIYIHRYPAHLVLRHLFRRFSTTATINLTGSDTDSPDGRGAQPGG